MSDPMVPNKTKFYRTGPLNMEQVGELETLLREKALVEMGGYIDIVFDGPPSMPAPRFVEVENDEGESIRVGEWIDRSDGFWVLRIPRPAPTSLVSDGAIVETVCNCGQCGRIHASGCAVHNEPAYPVGACDCDNPQGRAPHPPSVGEQGMS